MTAAHHIEAVVIGAGVVGLAVARALARKGKEVLILERATTIGTETSSRNSEVIHGGLYYPRDSLKAHHCVEGKRLLYDFVASHNIPYQQCGKLIVATSTLQQRTLQQLRDKAIQNGVGDVRLMSKDDVSVLEHEVVCESALWSPSTGVLDSHSFLVSLLADAQAHGALLSLSSHVESNGRGTSNVSLTVDDMILDCDIVVNCAGLHAHHVADRIHKNESNESTWKPPCQYFAKGNYFRLQQPNSGSSNNPFSHLVYPVPEEGGLGVHATIDWSNTTTKFGPDVEWIDSSISSSVNVDLTVEPSRADGFYDEIRKYWPHLQDGALVPDYAGLRPKLYHPSIGGSPGATLLDFMIAEPKDHGVAGLFHMFGIESPGLTSSMSIATYIAERATQT